MLPDVFCQVGKPLRLSGYAIDIGHAISAVEFSLDRGGHWTVYPTAEADAERRVNWTFDFTPPQAGRYELWVRSVNDFGKPSPEPDTVYLVAE